MTKVHSYPKSVSLVFMLFFMFADPDGDEEADDEEGEEDDGEGEEGEEEEDGEAEAEGDE